MMDKLIQEYEHLAHDKAYWKQHLLHDGLALGGISLIATPAEVRAFYDKVLSGELQDHSYSKTDEKELPNSLAAVFVDMLMRNGYQAGYNDFRLNGPIEDLLTYLAGSADERLRVTINGNLSDSLYGASYIDLTVHGDVSGDFAYKAEDVHAKINRYLDWDIQTPPFAAAKDSTFEWYNFDITQMLPGLPASSWHEEEEPQNCRFIARSKELTDFLNAQIPRGNEIYHRQARGLTKVRSKDQNPVRN